MSDVIELLKQAQTGCKELSVEVFKSLNPNPPETDFDKFFWELNCLNGCGLTESVDSALSLVPTEEKPSFCCVYGRGNTQLWRVELRSDEVYFSVDHVSLPIAICLAVLTAH